jgi:hypothetical protein
MRRTSAVLLAGCLVLAAACTTSPQAAPTATATTQHFSHPPARPARCPTSYPKADRYSVPGNHGTLVPDTPFSTVVCVYAFPVPAAPPRRVVLGSEPTQRIATLLDAAKRVPATGVFSCPNEDTIPAALFFDYRDGSIQLVTAATSGCLFASNGHIAAHEPKAALDLLRKLAARQP